MVLLLWIPMGFVVGWLAGKSVEGKGYGRLLDLLMGAGGAIVGGTVIRTAGHPGYGGAVLATFAAICCAAALTILASMANGRALYSRVL